MRFVFFGMNDFSHEGGGTIRMLGILNELAASGHEVVFISNVQAPEKLAAFHPSISHVYLSYLFSRQDKRIFQGLLGLLPVFLFTLLYARFFKRLKTVMAPYQTADSVYFFEYLDNSIGYWLFQKGLIRGYVNDLHGVATLEFKFQAQLATGLLQRIRFYIKYWVSNQLDCKVFTKAHGLIFASKAMQQYFEQQYPAVSVKKNYILPYVLSSGACDSPVDLVLREQLVTQLGILPQQRVVLFAGAFKKTGGVPDLIAAFASVSREHSDLRLLLVGDGPTYAECQEAVRHYGLESVVTFIGRIPYTHLRTYQDLAHVIVCPDKQNVYSELIVHVKYLDALISGKVVINGSFKSVVELNPDDFLSLTFTPSDVSHLATQLSYALTHLEALQKRYAGTPAYVCESLTYASHVTVLSS
ncbi:glycosyltransferase family 4 protein [Flavobacterium sp.]|uniref:glycosyltransferase family 4 protein n=1 Tax=Flavobacterium sp. TaxID=239 RepID=UPI002FDB01BD